MNMDITKIQQQAAEYLAQGEYSQAIAFYEQCIDTHPTLMLNYWHLGLAWLLSGEESTAQAIWFSAIAEGNPEEIDLWMAELLALLTLAANCHLRDHHFSLAEKIYWQIIELDSSQAEAYYNLGCVIAQQGNLDAAIDCWQKAINLDPSLTEAYQNQGAIFQKLGQFSEAINCCLKALEIQLDCQTAYNLGLCFSQQGRWDEAIVAFNQAIQIQPDYSPAYSDLGNAYWQQGKWQSAIAYFTQTFQINPNFSEAYCHWVKTLVKQGKSTDSINANASLLKAIQRQLDPNEIYLYLQQTILTRRKSNTKDIDKTQILVIDPPQGFYELTWNWFATVNVDKSNYTNIYPQNTLTLSPPKTPDKSIHFSFRFGNKVDLPASFVVTVVNGRYWLNQEQSSSAVITSENQLLGDISPEFPILSPGHPDNHPSKHSIFSSGKLPPIQTIDGTVAIVAGLQNRVYFHWMLDILPRLELLNRSGIDIDQIDGFLVDSHLPFQKETLDILGISQSKIIETDKYSHIQATKLIVPSFPGTVSWMPKWAVDFVRSRFLHPRVIATSEKIERLYISRQQATNRRIINEEQIINLLTQFGFQSITLESMSVAEQAALLANAKVVVSAHGSGLTNIVFCQPGTKIVEILSPHYVYHCYWLISNLVNLDYYYLLGEVPEGFYLHQLLYPNPRIEDIFVNLDRLLKMLEFAQLI